MYNLSLVLIKKVLGKHLGGGTVQERPLTVVSEAE